MNEVVLKRFEHPDEIREFELGKFEIVRLGGMENSSLRYFSAMRALEVSTSRMVSPSFSRNVRRFFPAAGSMVSASSTEWGTSYQALQ